MYEIVVVSHDDSGNNEGKGVQMVKEGSHGTRMRYDASVTPQVLHVPSLSCPELTNLKLATDGYGTDIVALQASNSAINTSITTLWSQMQQSQTPSFNTK